MGYSICNTQETAYSGERTVKAEGRCYWWNQPIKKLAHWTELRKQHRYASMHENLAPSLAVHTDRRHTNGKCVLGEQQTTLNQMYISPTVSDGLPITEQSLYVYSVTEYWATTFQTLLNSPDVSS